MLDLKAESERLLAGYRLEALRLTALGMGAIVLVLAFGLRNARAVLQVVLPVALALLITAAVLQLAGQRLTVFHLIAMLLVMGIGLNYSLFFDRPEQNALLRRRMLFALFVTCATTLLAFVTLAFSSNPVLHAIGLTVSVGAVAAFLASAALGAPMKPARRHRVYRDQRARPRQRRHARCAAPGQGRPEGERLRPRASCAPGSGASPASRRRRSPARSPSSTAATTGWRSSAWRRTASETRSRRQEARYGAQRIAVLLGTSTSGILQTELAYRRRDAEGDLPRTCAIATRRTSSR